MTWAGERSKHFCSFQSPEMFFLLTLPFIERRSRQCEVLLYFGVRAASRPYSRNYGKNIRSELFA